MSKFKTRARAVDMLGRQQIAGIPTAISELFKNAYDAYADSVEVDYFRHDNIFVLRDDGLGMTKEEFEERWLTLGTESRLTKGKIENLSPKDPDKKMRPIMGEKGIGRLAIAAIGPQVLILTRAKRNKKLQDLVISFIHWGVFEIPGINLEDIEIPVHVFKGGTLPDDKEIKQLISEFRSNINNLKNFIDVKIRRKISAELDEFNINPTELSEILGKPSLLDTKKGGTHFYILPASENLAADIDLDIKDEKVSDLRKLLLGFSNTMVPNIVPPPIRTAFRNWTTYGQYMDLIGEREFFTPQEFETADHHIQGEFDEFGQFKGIIRIYNEKPIQHVFSWPRSLGKHTICGPFKINIAYIQGTQRESKMPPPQYSDLRRKLDRISGLYIYRDGIRILPYGDTKFDFLELEERRSKSAGFYYFSYRNMFGAIEITKANNEKLVEKAGREGFQENKAYREFKEILINFFIQIAADFFRKGGEHAPVYERKKVEYDRLERARREQEKQSSNARRTLATELETFFSRIQNNELSENISDLLKTLSAKIENICKYKDTNEVSEKILMEEIFAFRKLEDLKKSLIIKKPTYIGLTIQLKRDWQAHITELELLDKELFKPAENKIKEIVIKSIKEKGLKVEQKHHVSKLLQEFVKLKHTEMKKEIEDTNKVAKEADTRISNLLLELNDDINNLIKSILNDFEKIDNDLKDGEDIGIFFQKIEIKLDKSLENCKEILEHLRTQIKNINWVYDEEGHLIGEDEMKAALEDEVLSLREQTEADLELTQLGMAIEIINHEFNNNIKSIRNNLRKFKAWSDLNPELQNLYKNIRNDFDHLDGYLTLFTPLQKRLYRNVISISGADIANYLTDLFGERMDLYKVELVAKKSFRQKTIEGYPSTFYPVFVNLVDNSIFWLKDRPLPRKIELDAIENVLIISDTGPGIAIRDYKAVFEFGFTRKPGGRGLGLYISREVLRKEGFELVLEPQTQGKGAVFKIFQKK